MAVKLIQTSFNPVSQNIKTPGPEQKYFFETAAKNLDAVGYLFNKGFMKENLIGQMYTSFYENNSEFEYDDNYSIYADAQLGEYQEYLSFSLSTQNPSQKSQLKFLFAFQFP